MTTPNGPILFNSSTGSDTQGSGLGPATAVFGTTGSCTSASAVVTGIDTTGVTAGDLFWGQTSSGRQFSIIASVDSATQVTLDDTLAATHSGDLTWAIGGKRLTLAGSSRLYISGGDMKAGWTIELGSGFTEIFASSLDFYPAGSTAAGPVTVRGESGSVTVPILTFSNNGDAIIVRDSRVHLVDFELQNTNATKTAGAAIVGVTSHIKISGLIISDATNYFYRGIDCRGQKSAIVGCDVGNCVDIGILNGTGAIAQRGWRVIRNSIHDCGSHGLHIVPTGSDIFGALIANNLIRDNGGDGILWADSSLSINADICITGNIFYNNTSDGIEVTGAGDGLSTLLIESNIFDSNGSYGVNFSSVSVDASYLSGNGALLLNNAYRGNTSGATNPASIGTDDTTLTADPFVDAANGDFNINNIAGGGASLRAVTVTL